MTGRPTVYKLLICTKMQFLIVRDQMGHPVQSSSPVPVDLRALPELDCGVPGSGGERARAPVHAGDGVAVRLEVVGGAAVLDAVGAQVVVLGT